MKNTRKKMLLSSIAMLLVALVALGSATYAWFVAKPTADAQGLTMKTESGLGLLVLSDTHKVADANGWSHNTVLRAKSAKENDVVVPNDAPFTLHPCSLSTSATLGSTTQIFYSATAAKDTEFKLDSNETIGGAVAGTDYYVEQIDTKVTGGAASANLYLTGINWTAGSNAESAAVRVAVYGTDNKLKGIFSTDGVANGYLSSTTAPADPNPNTYTPTAKTDTLASRLSLGTSNSAAGKKITVIVYLDGEDTANYSQNVDASTLLSNLKLDLVVASN